MTKSTTRHPDDAAVSSAQLTGAELSGPRRRVVAVDDTSAVTRHLLPERFTNLAQGRVGVLARPGMRRDSWLAADLLTALGCRQDVKGAGRPGDGDWDHVAAWLHTHQIRHLYVRHAWTLPLPILDVLLSQTTCTLWLAGDTPYTPAHADTLQPWTQTTLSGEEFLTHWAHLDTTEPTAAGTSPGTTTGTGWPHQVPDDDFTTFRAACRDLLTPATFEVVDAHFRSSITTAIGLVRSLPATSAEREVAVAAWLHQQWEQTESMSAYIVCVRATQVAFFTHRWFLQVDLDQVIGTAPTMPRRALRTPELWHRLHDYPEPHRGAICALAAAGLSVDTIRTLTLDSVAHNETTLDAVSARPTTDSTEPMVQLTDGTRVGVHPDGWPFLIAQAHLRRLHGATGSEPLIPSRAGTPLSGPGIAQIINDARRELGVAVTPDRLDRKPVTGDRWLTRWGVSLQELP